MSRIKKNTVDYFPHPVKDGDRMFVMETKFGMAGYACYYKLLQLLGRSEDHFADFNTVKTLMTFSASLKVNESLALEMLSALAELGTLDLELWNAKKIAWCQELVDSISTVYSDNRRRDIPQKPLITAENTPSAGFSAVNDLPNDHSTAKSTQSKVKESKVKESKVKESKVKELVFPFDSEEFLKIWEILINQPKWRKKTIEALQGNLKELSKAPNEADAIEMMQKSINGGWQGIFELDKNKNNGNKKNNGTSGASAVIGAKDYSGGLG